MRAASPHHACLGPVSADVPITPWPVEHRQQGQKTRGGELDLPACVLRSSVGQQHAGREHDGPSIDQGEALQAVPALPQGQQSLGRFLAAGRVPGPSQARSVMDRTGVPGTCARLWELVATWGFCPVQAMLRISWCGVEAGARPGEQPCRGAQADRAGLTAAVYSARRLGTGTRSARGSLKGGSELQSMQEACQLYTCV